jgi:hypothetical protein
VKVYEVNKLLNLAQRIAEALEKIAKESHRQNSLLGGDLALSEDELSAPLEKPAPKLEYGGGSL